MTTPNVDLSAINPLAEIIVRGGDASAPNARRVMKSAYIRVDPAYPDAVGLSSLFRVGATLDELAREGSFPHQKLSFSIVGMGKIMQELAAGGFELVLFVTPTPTFPDHHSLAVAKNGNVQPTLADDAADALIRAMTVVDNPYMQHP
jgi:hypothetical protein